MKLFSKHLSLLERGLDLRAKRNQYIASNIANRETPGYHAKDLVFEKQLAKSLEPQKDFALRTSDPRHINGSASMSVKAVDGEIINSFNPDPRKDGNTVNMDKELAKLAENHLMYNAMTRMTGHKLNLLKEVITESSR